jgi:ATP-binding cassette subfamily C protein
VRRGLLADARLLVGAAWELSPKRLTGQVILLLLGGLIGGVSLLLLIPIVNSVADTATGWQLPLLGDVDLGGIPLGWLLAAFVALTAIQALITRASAVNSVSMQQVLVDRLRQQAFDAILAARWTFVLQRRRSDVIEVVTSGAARSGAAFSQLMQLSVTAVLAVATAVVALLVSPAVAAVAIVGVLVLGLALSSAIGPAHKLGRAFGERSRHLQSVMLNSMDSLRLVRAHNASATWARQLSEAFQGTREVQIANVRRSATVSAFSAVGLALAASLLVLLAVWAQVPPASVVVILVLVARLARQVQQSASIGATLANLLPAVGDLTDLTAQARLEVEQPAGAATNRATLSDARFADGGDPPGVRARASSEALMSFRNVSFTYPSSDTGVHGVTFDVVRGDITVLTGPSGAGKSTLADLALGLLLPSEGQVIVAGEPLIPADLSWWRDHVAYVPQETVLVPGTLRENLVWSARVGGGDPPDDTACWRALEQAAAGFARGLPDGLDTMLGDRGVRLSGGERQRIAIARALLRNPELLVLDEATSALDDASEAAVLQVLSSLVPAVTLLVVAHRRTTVDFADHVVRLVAGRVEVAASG